MQDAQVMKALVCMNPVTTVKSLYNTPRINTDLDKTVILYHIILQRNYRENDHFRANPGSEFVVDNTLAKW